MKTLLDDLRHAWGRQSMRWLNMSVLVYVAILPFNAFGFTFPVASYTVKYTEAALFLIVLFGVLAWRRGAMQLVRAPWLYTFLALHVVAQFLSLINASNVASGVRIALAASSYAVLVIIVVNAVRSEELLRTVLVVMGFGAAIVILHSTWVFIVQGGVFMTRLATQPSIIGNEIPHYFAYLLIMFGTGILYVAYRVRGSIIRYSAWALIFLWAFFIFASASKFAQVGIFLALILLAVTCRRELRAVACTACLVALALVVQWKIVPLKNAVLATTHGVQQRVAVVQHERSSRIASYERFALDPTAPSMLTEAAAIVIDASDRWQRIVQYSEVEGVEIAVVQAPPDGLAVRAPTITPSAVPPATVTPSAVPPATVTPSAVPPATVTPSAVPPATVTPSAVVVAPKFIDEYAAENNFVSRWRAVGPMDVRFRGWAIALLLWSEHPFIGIGVTQATPQVIDDASRVVASHVGDPSFLPYLPFRSRLLSGHTFQDGVVAIYNIYLNALAETGLLGLLAFLGLLSVVVVRSIIALVRQSLLRRRCALQFFLPVLLALLGSIHMGEYLWLHPWLWTLLGLTYASARIALGVPMNVSRGVPHT